MSFSPSQAKQYRWTNLNKTPMSIVAQKQFSFNTATGCIWITTIEVYARLIGQR